MDKILVVDFGSQYNQLICRRVREMGVYAELVSRNTSIDVFNNHEVKGIIFTGGPKSVYDSDAYTIDSQIYQLKKPILGICYGHQRICQDLGGKVGKAKKSEYGKSIVHYTKDSLLFSDIPNDSVFWMSHGDEIIEMPKDFELLASTETNKYTVMKKDYIYSTQFHPEVMHSKYGKKLMSNFVLKICQAKPEFSMENYQNILIQNIKDEVKDKKVLCGISGGVDSTVVATLVHKAIGNNLTCMFIDHGLLRKNERESVEKVFGKLNINLVVVDAKKTFLEKLKDVSDPEQKRKIIGNEFIYTFERECKKIGTFDYLAQGTLYTDVIESGVTGTSNTIKSHHNVGGLPEKMHFKLIEPLNTLFKDEARQLGRVLGLPDNMVNRQPFPGPGLAIRIIGDITDDKLRIVKESDQILRDILDKEKGIWQYFTVLTNIKSVGVVGDQRSYNYTVAIRAVGSIDGMTADFSRLDWEVLAKISNRITNEVKGVNRVVYDITSKPPATIEWE